MPDEKEWKAIITRGENFNNILLEQIDEVAEGLKKLEELHIPVLWRPYHEMNGIWFWWGNKQGDDGFKALWNIMYDRFTNFHGLSNLIWVWNTNAPRDWENDQAYAYDLFFPGPEYVDVLAADIYKKDYKQSHHDDLLSLANGKLIALGEIGIPPSADELDNQSMWSWFMMWANWPIKVVAAEDLNALYHHPRVTNFDEYLKQ
jgi:mannan endo-1,4-beta-mannosidase